MDVVWSTHEMCADVVWTLCGRFVVKRPTSLISINNFLIISINNFFMNCSANRLFSTFFKMRWHNHFHVKNSLSWIQEYFSFLKLSNVYNCYTKFHKKNDAMSPWGQPPPTWMCFEEVLRLIVIDVRKKAWEPGLVRWRKWCNVAMSEHILMIHWAK